MALGVQLPARGLQEGLGWVLVPCCQRALGSSTGIRQVVINRLGLINAAGEGGAGGDHSRGVDVAAAPQPSTPCSAPPQPLSSDTDGSAFLLLLLLLPLLCAAPGE